MLLGLVQRTVRAQLLFDLVVGRQRLGVGRAELARGLALGEREIVDAVLGHDARGGRGDPRAHFRSAVVGECPCGSRLRFNHRISSLHGGASSHPRHLRHVHGRNRRDRQGRRLSRHRLRCQRLSADERPAARARHRAHRGLRRRPARARARRLGGRQRRDPRQPADGGDPRRAASATSPARNGSPKRSSRASTCSLSPGTHGKTHGVGHARLDPRARGPRARFPDRRGAERLPGVRPRSTRRRSSSSRRTSTTPPFSTSAPSSSTTARGRRF